MLVNPLIDQKWHYLLLNTVARLPNDPSRPVLLKHRLPSSSSPVSGSSGVAKEHV